MTKSKAKSIPSVKNPGGNNSLPDSRIQNTAPSIALGELFTHLSSTTGLYSKETFLSLYGCLTRMIRDHHLQGVVLVRTLSDDAFEAMTCALEGQQDISLYRLEGPETGLSTKSGLSDGTGFLLVLTNRLCAAVHWHTETSDTFKMYDGGWTFHPGDAKTLSTHITQHLEAPLQAELTELLERTAVDRRYDDKLNLLVTSLVEGLENRNRQLMLALDQVNRLNHKVIESERMAAVGQLSSVIAHEIRNPLGLIDLYAKLVEVQLEKTTIEDDKARETLTKNLSQIREATGCLETILSELTSYARPLTLNKKPHNILQFVEDICEFYSPSYAEKSVKIEVVDALSEKETNVLMDVERIRQALINLLKNALEVSEAGKRVIITVASRKGDDVVYIKVADEGPGVDDKNAAKLFTPYFSTKAQGTGLGLAHSRKILQAHGGSVELLSTEAGHGATFALILPKQNREGE